jgi:hypothetical protein
LLACFQALACFRQIYQVNNHDFPPARIRRSASG